MLTFNGYVPIRRGLIEHLQLGRMTPQETLVYVILLIWADHRTGIATTNAAGIVFLSGHQLNQSVVQKKLASLERKGYIKRPFFVQGQRGDQRIFIGKYVVTDGVLKGRVLTFAKTTDWENPVYEDVTETATEGATETASDRADVRAGVRADSNKKLRTENEEVRKKKLSGSAEANPVHQSSIDRLSVEKQEQQQQPNPQDSVPNPTGDTSRSPDPKRQTHSAKAEGSSAPAPYRDRGELIQGWGNLLIEFTGTDLEPQGTDFMTWESPSRLDIERLFTDTVDSVETVVAVARWGIEVSSHWFKPGKGMLRSFTDFVNAYGKMSEQYAKYQRKAHGAIA